MKILISIDIEGVAGVYHHEQVRAGHPEYEHDQLPLGDVDGAALTRRRGTRCRAALLRA